MPSETAQWHYRDFELRCRPRRLDDGRFGACAVIIATPPRRAPSQCFLDLEAFECEALAIERARLAAMDWIDTVAG